jgi:hypothetical protein
MAFAHSVATAHNFAPTRDRKPGLFRRLLDAMMLARQREAEREIARYLERCGGKFSDETEREIERRYLSNPNW